MLKTKTQHKHKNLFTPALLIQILDRDHCYERKALNRVSEKKIMKINAISIWKLIILPTASHYDKWLFDWWVEHCQYWLTSPSLSANHINKHPGMTAYWKQSHEPVIIVEVWWNALCFQKSNDMPASPNHTHIPILTETLSKLTTESDALQ